MEESAKRIIGFDMARALAILGMVIVNYKISMNAEENGPEWLKTMTGLLEGRASAIFVILAGIGISLMTKKARMSGTPSKKYRKMIWRRSLFLFVLGMILFLMHWSADILHYYAFYMFIAYFFIVASSRQLIIAAVGIVLTSQISQLLLNYEYGWDTTFKYYETFWTWKGFISNLFFNGYHPIFPWVAFLLFGMWLGRVNVQNSTHRKKMMSISLIAFLLTEAASYTLIKLSEPAVGLEIAYYLFDTKPMPPTLLYMISSTSTAIIVILLCVMISEKWRETAVIQAFVYTGQLALTLYIAHFLVLAVFFMFGGLAENTLPLAVTTALIFFLFSTVISTWWRKSFKRGPIEAMMRKVS
ncbi:heparan-alpha-glucosaminide N-acetyltransferase domain-containing protein (plasmid) [Cytobacillus spongiae]|uniref:DUF418 domain-containing protein n=1 Tax=Cytobacillus spongiae TaxID=2901381 RepID=UPI001F194B60|nr:heparan-alpha-glucosaminide N-acetyltransferase domain-containing protein [Cytobacillus spongiae]UII58598.1 heparan-alpha-glucosaminide N-acetyltransferase domain-containing protein [Cytobacillus spongiae]